MNSTKKTTVEVEWVSVGHLLERMDKELGPKVLSRYNLYKYIKEYGNYGEHWINNEGKLRILPEGLTHYLGIFKSMLQVKHAKSSRKTKIA